MQDNFFRVKNSLNKDVKNDIDIDINKIEFVDLHNHILPYVDDGSDSENTSIDMLKIAYDDGVRHIIATPHYIPGELENISGIVKSRLLSIIEKCKNIDLKVNIYPGNEIFISPDIPDLIENGSICTLNNSSYVLIELPLMSIPPYTQEVLYKLQLKGYKPIIAHPERNSEVITDPNVLYDFVKRGILVQSNSNSFLGLYGKNVKETAFKLLNHSMVHFVSSDAHGIKRRSPKLYSAFKLVAESLDPETGLDLFSKNGMAVINNLDIKTSEPEEIKNKKSFILSTLMKLVNIHL
ncbi:MAG TPA: capsular biosynthesis protein CpsB [Clostridiaceae bacterium]|nr:capsular biosynthesis protein CpsB [Clostridiaceae bacterium]